MMEDIEMALTTTKKKEKKGRKVNPLKEYKAIVSGKGNAVTIGQRLFSKGQVYNLSEAEAVIVEKDPNMTVIKMGEKFPKAGQKPKKGAEPKGIPQEYVDTLQEFDAQNVSDAPSFVSKIKDVKLLEFLAKNAEKSGSKKAAGVRYGDLTRRAPEAPEAEE